MFTFSMNYLRKEAGRSFKSIKISMNGNGKSKSKAAQAGNGNSRRNGNGGNTMRQISTRAVVASSVGNSRPIQNKLTTLSGSDFLSTISVTPSPSVNQRILKVLPISPSAFPGTRLTQMSQLWEFFKFTKFHVRYVPAVPTTLACQLVLYLDLDPSDDPSTITDPDALIRQAVAQTGSQQWNFHGPKVIPLAMRADRQFYFTGADKANVRFSQQGVAYLIQVTSPVNFNGETLPGPLEAGSLFIDWTVQFNIPQINPSAAITSSPISALPTTTIDLSDATGSIDRYDVVGLAPRRFYVLSHRIYYPDSLATGTTLLCRYRDTTYASYARFSTEVRTPADATSGVGYLVVQSDDNGRIDDLSISAAPSSLDPITTHELLITTLYEEPVLTGSASRGSTNPRLHRIGRTVE